jgi:hypothetical protein
MMTLVSNVFLKKKSMFNIRNAMMSAFNLQGTTNVISAIRSSKIQVACIDITKHIKINKRRSILLMPNKMERYSATSARRLTAIVEI